MGGILTGAEIVRQVVKGGILITPFDSCSVNPNSYNLRLDLESAKVSVDDAYFDSEQNNDAKFRSVQLDHDGSLTLEPGKLYLASTVEKTATNRFAPLVIGRSSLARLGVSTTQSAGFGDIGFNGKWTLSISVVRPVRLYDRQKIAQVYFLKPAGKIKEVYHGKYQFSDGCQLSRSFLDWR